MVLSDVKLEQLEFNMIYQHNKSTRKFIQQIQQESIEMAKTAVATKKSVGKKSDNGKPKVTLSPEALKRLKAAKKKKGTRQVVGHISINVYDGLKMVTLYEGKKMQDVVADACEAYVESLAPQIDAAMKASEQFESEEETEEVTEEEGEDEGDEEEGDEEGDEDEEE